MANLQDNNLESDKKGDDTPSAPPAETNESGDATASSAEGEGETPKKDAKPEVFHKHPRWIELQNKLRDQETQLNELRGFKENILKELTSDEDSVPEWFSSVFGDDPEVWTKYQAYEAEREKKSEEKILGKEKEKQEKAKEYDSWIESEVGKIEEELGKKFSQSERNDLLNTAKENFITNQDGSLNLKKVHDNIWKKSKINPSDFSLIEKKNIADKTMDGTIKNSGERNYKISSDFDNGLSF